MSFSYCLTSIEDKTRPSLNCHSVTQPPSPPLGSVQTLAWWKYLGNSGNTGYLQANYAVGVIKWKFKVAELPGPAVIGPDGTVYFGQSETASGLFAVDGASGTLKWSIPDFANFGGAPAIVTIGLLYVYLTNGLNAINAQNGQIVWSNAEITACRVA